MLLADCDIELSYRKGHIKIEPEPDWQVALSGCAVDLRLGNEFQIFDHTKITSIDVKKPNFHQLVRNIKIDEGESFTLQSGEFALATTLEWVEIPVDLAARLEGRSSLGRLGIIVHSTAALIHPGFIGKIVLELSNLSRLPVVLYAGMRACAISFEKLTNSAVRPYSQQPNAKYSHQEGVKTSKIAED